MVIKMAKKKSRSVYSSCPNIPQTVRDSGSRTRQRAKSRNLVQLDPYIGVVVPQPGEAVQARAAAARAGWAIWPAGGGDGADLTPLCGPIQHVRRRSTLGRGRAEGPLRDLARRGGPACPCNAAPTGAGADAAGHSHLAAYAPGRYAGRIAMRPDAAPCAAARPARGMRASTRRGGDAR